VPQKELRLSKAPAALLFAAVPDNGCSEHSFLADEAPLTSTSSSSHQDRALPDAPSLIPRPPMPPLNWVKKAAPPKPQADAPRGTHSLDGLRRARPLPEQTHTSDEEPPSPEPRSKASHPFRRVSSRLVPPSARAASDPGPGVSDPGSGSAAAPGASDGWDRRSVDSAKPLALDDRPLKPPPRSPRSARRAARRRASALAPLHNRLSSWQPSDQPSPEFDRAVEGATRSSLEGERSGAGQGHSSAGEASPVKMPTPFKPRLKLGRSPPVSVR
jgi:hypothetical protein